MNDVVVVIRMESGDDILAIMRGEFNGKIRIESPYYVKVTAASSNVIMMPYCPLSDERFYELNKDKIEFLVTANRDISIKFLKMLDTYDDVASYGPEEDDSDIDWLKSSYSKPTTKH